MRIFFLYTLGIIHGTSVFVFGTFCNDDDAAVFGFSEPSADELFQLVDIGLILGNDGSLSTRCYRTVLSQEPCVSSHYFDEEDTIMRSCRVAYLVYTLYDGIECRVVSDSVVGTVEIVVDGSRKADADDVIFFGEDTRTR